MDNQLDALKKHWKGLSSSSMVDQQNLTPDCSQFTGRKSVSNRRKLLRGYRMLAIVGGLFIVLAPQMLYPLHMFPLWAIALLSVYFGICTAMNIYAYSLVKSVNLAEMPTLELLERVRRIYRVHIRQTVLGISMCVPMLSMMMWFFYADPAVFLGGVCGGILGGVIGWNRNLKIRRYLREIEAELRSAYA